jgi:hypothetical protein
MGFLWSLLRLLAAFNMLTKPTRTIGRRTGYRAVRRIFR